MIAAAEQRSVYLKDEVTKLEPAAAGGFVTRKYLEDRRVELNNTRERITDAREAVKWRVRNRRSGVSLDGGSPGHTNRCAMTAVAGIRGKHMADVTLDAHGAASAAAA